MDRTDLDALLEQLRNIILNKPISQEIKSESEDLADLQEAIVYLSNCLSESNEFLRHLSVGNLEVQPPSRHNFLAGSLKELHSGLKHLTWQANQVANGDYNQRVSFLGDFSSSFNQMVHQLSERELKLKQQSAALIDTVDLMKSIMDGLKDWIIVTDKENGQIIYTNQSAKQLFYDIETGKHICGSQCELMTYIQSYHQEDCGHFIFEYSCPLTNKFLRTKSFVIQWNDQLAYAHYIADVTHEKEYKEQIVEMAYTDELTGLYNRRYCVGKLDMLLEQNEDFTFCMIDLDGLKFVNDNFGHVAGDDYLKSVAEGLLQISRATDAVCRIGGDEFAVLFPNCIDEVVLSKMKRLDEKMCELSKAYPMSISYGAIYIRKGASFSSKTVMEQADEKMYTLKNFKRYQRAKEEQ